MRLRHGVAAEQLLIRKLDLELSLERINGNGAVLAGTRAAAGARLHRHAPGVIAHKRVAAQEHALLAHIYWRLRLLRRSSQGAPQTACVFFQGARGCIARSQLCHLRWRGLFPLPTV